MPCNRVRNDDKSETDQKRKPSPQLEPLEGRQRNSGSVEDGKSRTEAADSRQPSAEAELQSKRNSKVTPEPSTRSNDFEEQIEYVSKPNSQILPAPYTTPNGFDEHTEYAQKPNSMQILLVPSTRPDDLEDRNGCSSARTLLEGCRCRFCLEEKRRRELSVQHHDDCECRQCIEKRMKSVHHEMCQCYTCMEKKYSKMRISSEQSKMSFERSQTPPSPLPPPPPPLPPKDFSSTELTSAPCGQRPDELQSARRCPAQSERFSPTDDELERIIDRKIDEIIRPLLKSLANNEQSRRYSQPAEHRRSETDEMLAAHFKPKCNPACSSPLPPANSSPNMLLDMMVNSFCNKYNEMPKRKPYPMAPPFAYQEMSFDGIPSKYHSDQSCTSLHSNTKNRKYGCPAAAPYHFDDIMSCKSYTSDDEDY